VSRDLAGEDDLLARPGRSTWRVVLVVLVVATAAAAISYYATRRSNAGTTGAATVQRQTSLVPVTRRDLVETASYDGSVAYADQRAITAPAAGTVTRTTSVGRVLHRGDRLFRIDEQPVVLFYGAFPLYRPLNASASAGPDITELETNLAALGYAPSGMTVDDTWDADTTTAVDAWEAALGVTEDGAVPLGRVVVAAGPVRVAANATVGDAVQPGATVATVSGTRRDATVSLAVTDAAIAKVGAAVTVTLPSGDAVRGRIRSVGTTATAQSTSQGGATNQGGASSATSSATVDVTISLPDAKALAGLDTAPVSVAFVQTRATGALAVPTTALLTTADGAFAVEVADGGSATHLVQVTPGLFAAGGYVAVTGNVKEGDRVVVPQ
jgi:peptidoglycan hydrolase-like protein with peptidoglycan-binding domain